MIGRDTIRHAVGLALLICAALSGGGCYFTHGGPEWAPGAAAIEVPLVVSHLRTDELTRSLEARITAELRRRASQGDLGGCTLVSGGRADLRLDVELVEVAQKVIRVDLYNVPIERQVVIRANYRLTGAYGQELATGVADSRVSALAGNYDLSRGENSELGRDSAIAAVAQAIIEAVNDDRLQAADRARAQAAKKAAADQPAASQPAADQPANRAPDRTPDNAIRPNDGAAADEPPPLVIP